MLPIVRNQKQRNAVEKRRAKLNEISAAAHSMDRDNSGSLAHESLQHFLVALLMKIPIKMWTVTVVAFFFFFFNLIDKREWLPTNLSGGPW